DSGPGSERPRAIAAFFRLALLLPLHRVQTLAVELEQVLRVFVGLTRRASGAETRAGAAGRLALAGGERDKPHHVERDVFVATRAGCGAMSAFVHECLAECTEIGCGSESSCISYVSIAAFLSTSIATFLLLRFDCHMANAADDQIGI